MTTKQFCDMCNRILNDGKHGWLLGSDNEKIDLCKECEVIIRGNIAARAEKKK